MSKKKIALWVLVSLLLVLIPSEGVTVWGANKTTSVTVAKKKKTKKVTVTVGDKLTIKAKGGKGYKYKSSKKSVATVSKKGVVKAKKAGTTTITITAKNKKKAAVKLTVKQRKKKTKNYTYYSLSAGSLELKMGESFKLTFRGEPAGDDLSSKAKWYSSAPGVVSVNRKGKLKAIQEGTATVTAEYSGLLLDCNVTVKHPFDEYEARQKMRYSFKACGKGVAVIVKNNYKYTCDIEMSIAFKDINGNMLDSKKDTLFAVEKGKEGVLWFSAPTDSNYKTVAYSSYEYSDSIKLSDFYRSIGVDNIVVSSNRGADNITAKFTNISSEKAAFIPISCLFYDRNGYLIDYEWGYADCESSGSTAYETFRYPVDENYETIIPASYKVYVDGAYTYSYS